MEKGENARASTKKDHQCNMELEIDIPDDLMLEPVLWPECCIYKVPKNLRELNKEVYTPQLISIGPLHHGNGQAQMEKQKLIYLSEFFKRTNCKVTWKDFVSILEKDEERIRRCYAEKSELSSQEYVKMILLDSVFIIEHFIRVVENREHIDDYLLGNPWLRNGVHNDLLLLENQLPYFVLNDLYNLACPPNHNHNSSFHLLTYKFFKKHSPWNLIIADQTGVLHFTDLLRYFMSANRWKHSEHSKHASIQNPPSAANLHEAGVKFKGIERGCLSDISFQKGMLIMPQFTVEDSTELVICNLMALEQCHYPYNAYIYNYVYLMDFLINTAKDVDLLVEKGVIVNWLGSNEAVANMVNKLCINTNQSNFYFHDICEDLNKHYKKRRHRAMKTYNRAMKSLWSVYFTNIWRGTSTIAAVILLVMTLLQTINSFQQLP